MIDLSTYLTEAKKNDAPEYSKSEIDKVNSACKFAKLMLGTEDETEHVYLKPVDATRFFDTSKLYVSMFDLEKICKASAELANSIYILVGSYDAIDHTSRINNVNRKNMSPALPNTGMFYATKKEAQGAAKRNKYSICAGAKGKVLVMTLKELIDTWNEKTFSEYGVKYNHLKYFETNPF
jgi:hypothetical protein